MLGSSSGLKVVTRPPGSGYGDAACEYIAGLATLGVPVTWSPVYPVGEWWRRKKFLRKHLRDDIQNKVMALRHRRIDYDTFLLCVPPPVPDWLWKEKKRYARLFTYVTWEADGIPEDWAPALNQYERVFVPCNFNRKTFLKEGVTTEIDIVPHIAMRPNPLG